MKNILILSVLILFASSTNSYGVCLLENLQKDKSCTGAAAVIEESTRNNSDLSDQTQTNKEDLIRMYQIPTISYPSALKNGFPILNPAANCAFGMCQPR